MTSFFPLLCVALLLGTAWTAQAQDLPAMGNRDLSFVASTPEARFYSDFWLNLHDYLYGRVGGGPGDAQIPEEGTACLADRPEAERDAWRAAEAYYAAEMPDRHHRTDPLVRAIRLRLAGVATSHSDLADSTLALLAEAAPAYRACLWETHDTRNRQRIADLLQVVVTHGPPLRRALERVYRADWPAGLVVDVTPYASAAGANTTSGRGGPLHTMLSNADPDLVGWSGIELLFHEGSHVMFGARHGEVARALRAASAETGVERPGPLWHALSFHTSGRIVQEMAAAEGDSYTPYYIRRGIFAEFVPVFEEHWELYLRGEATMDEAAVAVVQALGPEAEE